MITEDKFKPLRLVDGKFMRGDEEVPIEIGNREQIDLLQRIERAKDHAEKYGIDCEFSATGITYSSLIHIRCICCDAHIHDKNDLCEADYLDDIESSKDWEGTILSCPNCKQKYTIENGKAKCEPKRP